MTESQLQEIKDSLNSEYIQSLYEQLDSTLVAEISWDPAMELEIPKVQFLNYLIITSLVYVQEKAK